MKTTWNESGGYQNATQIEWAPKCNALKNEHHFYVEYSRDEHKIIVDLLMTWWCLFLI